MTLKTMNVIFPWNKGFFQGHFGLTRCILFHSFHSWKSMQLVRPKWPFKKPLFHGNLTFIVFFVPSLTFFIMNVEKIHFFSFFCTTHNILKNAIFKKRLDERKRKLKNNLYFLFKKIELKVYKKTVKNII